MKRSKIVATLNTHFKKMSNIVPYLASQIKLADDVQTLPKRIMFWKRHYVDYKTATQPFYDRNGFSLVIFRNGAFTYREVRGFRNPNFHMPPLTIQLTGQLTNKEILQLLKESDTLNEIKLRLSCDIPEIVEGKVKRKYKKYKRRKTEEKLIWLNP